MTKKIIVISSSSLSLINFRFDLLRELVIKGNEVMAVAPSDKNENTVRAQLKKIGVILKVFPFSQASLNQLKNLRSYRALHEILKNFDPNIVIAYTAKPVIYSGMYCRNVSKIDFYPLITGLGYGFIDGSGIKRKLIKYLLVKLYQKSLRLASGVIFQNLDDENTFRRLLIIKKKTKSHIVSGSGVDLKKYPYSELPSKPIFLMLARLLIDKGIREYFQAARMVRLRFPNEVFQLAGGIDSNPSSININELNLWTDRGDIEYLGEVNCSQSILASCRFCVLPSYREGTPRSVLEALATGRPIITTDVPGCRETVVHGKNGLLVPPKDSDALANAMISLLQEKNEVIENMARESFILAKNKYDVKKVNKNIFNIIGL